MPPIALVSTPDVVDAALRLGERERAVEAVERFGRLVSGQPRAG